MSASSAVSPSSLVYLVTGCSSGFGREFVKAILQRNDKVIATARSIDKIQDLQQIGAAILQLDVTAGLESLQATMRKAVAIYGRIDVLINNAGIAMTGALEDLTPEETLQQFDTNVFGLLNCTRAILPHMREKKSGKIIIIGSVVGWRSTPAAGIYAASKFAIEGVAEALRGELAPLNIDVLLVEPGLFTTDVFANMYTRKPKIEAYTEIVEQRANALSPENSAKMPGDPVKLVQIVLDVSTSKGVANGKKMPFRLPMGSDSYQRITEKCKDVLKELEPWKEIIMSSDK